MNEIEELNNKFENVKVKEIYKEGYIKWVECECLLHGPFKKRLFDFKRSAFGCPKCGMKNANNKYQKPWLSFLEKAKKVHGDKYIYPNLTTYYNNDKIKIICPKHGEFEQKAELHLKGRGCPKCGIDKVANSQRLTQDEVIKNCKAVGGENYDYSKIKWIDTDHDIELVCKKHGSYWTRYNDFIKKKAKCPACSRENRRKLEERKFKDEMIKKYGNNIVFPKDFNYVNSYTKVKLIYKNEEFYRKPSVFLKSQLFSTEEKKERINLRGLEKSKKRWANILDELNLIHKNKYEYKKEEIEAIKNGELRKDGLMHIKCPKHGEFTQTFFDHRNGSGCKKCGIENRPIINFSKAEREIVDFIKSFYKGEIIQNDRKILNGREIDIYIPELKIAFEYDGLFWHNNVNNSYKFEKCKKQGVRLIRITEPEWLKNNNKIKNFIKAIFGFSDKKIYARNCVIKEIDNKIYKEFCAENHLQGFSPATVKLGLFFENELVQIMSFGKPRFNKKVEWELIRECSKLGYFIIGGKEKLLKYFERTYKPKSILSYCEKDKFSGKSYIRNGFKLYKESQPSYTYYYKHDYISLSRLNFQKHKLKNLLESFDENLTEWENMKNNGYMRLFDYGNFVFIKEYELR